MSPRIPGAGRDARLPSRFAWLWLAALAAAGPSLARATAAPRTESSATASGRVTGWSALVDGAAALPLDDPVRETYGSDPRPGFGGGLRYAWSPRFRAQVRLDWHRASEPLPPGLAASAEGTLTLLPFTTEFQYRPVAVNAGGRPLTFWFGLGPAVVFSREELEYRLFGETTTLRGRRSDMGGCASTSIELAFDRLTAGVTGRAVVTGGHRETLRPGGRTDEGEASSTPTHLAIALGLAYRF